MAWKEKNIYRQIYFDSEYKSSEFPIFFICATNDRYPCSVWIIDQLNLHGWQMVIFKQPNYNRYWLLVGIIQNTWYGYAFFLQNLIYSHN